MTGITPFAIIRASYQAGNESFTLVCDPGNGLLHTVSPDLRSALSLPETTSLYLTEPVITLIRAVCFSGVWHLYLTAPSYIHSFVINGGTHLHRRTNLTDGHVLLIPSYDSHELFTVTPEIKTI